MSFPGMAEAFWDWDSCSTLQLIKKKVSDFEVTEDPIVNVTFRGILQPMPPQKLLVKPEGQRNWKYWELWTTQFLENDSIILDAANTTFRVMSREDWSGAQYFHYELTQGVPGE